MVFSLSAVTAIVAAEFLAHLGGVWQQLEHQHDDQPYVQIDPVQRAVDSVYVAIRGPSRASTRPDLAVSAVISANETAKLDLNA